MSPQDKSRSVELVCLPLELYLCFTDFMSFEDHLHLKSLNRKLYHAIPPPSLAKLLRYERENRDPKRRFACKDCMRLLPGFRFADEVFQPGAEPAKRYCIQCALKPDPSRPTYVLGSQVSVGGYANVICRCCHENEWAEGDCLLAGYCPKCWQSYKRACEQEDRKWIDASTQLRREISTH